MYITIQPSKRPGKPLKHKNHTYVTFIHSLYMTQLLPSQNLHSSPLYGFTITRRRLFLFHFPFLHHHAFPYNSLFISPLLHSFIFLFNYLASTQSPISPHTFSLSVQVQHPSQERCQHHKPILPWFIAAIPNCCRSI